MFCAIHLRYGCFDACPWIQILIIDSMSEYSAGNRCCSDAAKDFSTYVGTSATLEGRPIPAITRKRMKWGLTSPMNCNRTNANARKCIGAKALYGRLDTIMTTGTPTMLFAIVTSDENVLEFVTTFMLILPKSRSRSSCSTRIWTCKAYKTMIPLMVVQMTWVIWQTLEKSLTPYFLHAAATARPLTFMNWFGRTNATSLWESWERIHNQTYIHEEHESIIVFCAIMAHPHWRIERTSATSELIALKVLQERFSLEPCIKCKLLPQVS